MSIRILFTGYAPVHFVCFKSICQQLAGWPGVQVLLSGGIRTKIEDGYVYDQHRLYGPFGIPAESLVPVDDLADLDVDVLICANTNRIEPRSARYTVEMFHGLSFRNRSLRLPNVGQPDFYWVLGPYMRRILNDTGLVPYGDPHAVEIGFPKTDPLLDGSLSRDVLLAASGFAGDRPILLYAPTGTKGNSMRAMGKQLIKRLRDEDAYDVLVKPHDHSDDGVDWFERLAKYEGAHMRLVRSADVVPNLFLADVLVSDASSVSNEYALLDRPMVFIDVPELIEMERARGTNVDLETWGRKAGTLAHDPDSVVAAVADELVNPCRASAVRQGIARDLFYNPGGASDAAVRWLENLLRQAPARPAYPVAIGHE